MIRKLESKIRDYINLPRRQIQIMKNTANWNKLCSALDLIGDTELAIEAYPSLYSNSNDGVSYLIVYGILQTLLLQQDAAQHIADALGLEKIKRPKQLDEIRVIRNSAAGHPTSQKEKGAYKSCFITRISLSPRSFQMVITSSNSSEYQYKTVKIPTLLKIQKTYIAKLLEQVSDELKRQEMEHRSMYQNNKLQDVFPQTLSYHLDKIYEGTFSPQVFKTGKDNLDAVVSFLKNFKNTLESRSEWEINDSIKYRYEYIEHALEQLNKYFIGDSTFNNNDAYIFVSFVARELNELKAIVKEIDEKYESEC
ncbi:hypothetical protein AAIB78_000246 [Morganella morganii]